MKRSLTLLVSASVLLCVDVDRAWPKDPATLLSRRQPAPGRRFCCREQPIA